MEAVEKMKTVESEIMTTPEVAQYLRLSEATIYTLAQSGDIPAVKVGRTWRFKRELIDEWFKEQATTRSTELEESTETPAGKD